MIVAKCMGSCSALTMPRPVRTAVSDRPYMVPVPWCMRAVAIVSRLSAMLALGRRPCSIARNLLVSRDWAMSTLAVIANERSESDSEAQDEMYEVGAVCRCEAMISASSIA